MFKNSSPIPFALRSLAILIHFVFLGVFVGFNFEGFGQVSVKVPAFASVSNTETAGQHLLKPAIPVHPKKSGIRLNKRFHPESFLADHTICELVSPEVIESGYSSRPVCEVIAIAFLPFGLRAPPVENFLS